MHPMPPEALEAADCSPALTDGPLTARTMADLAAFFAAGDHRPSRKHLAALRATARVMEDMADGCCPDRVYLAAIDCGIGKTQTTVHFAQALAASPGHQEAGMVICVARLSQVRDLAAALDLPHGSLAVLTSDPALNALGAAAVNDAQVLLTTQQRVERASHAKQFGDVESLYYRGRPRGVRVWDEAFAFGAPVVLSWKDIASLTKLAGTHSEAFANALFDFSAAVRRLNDGAEVLVPDFEADHGVNLRELMADCAAGGASRNPLGNTLGDLLALNGRVARAFVENDRGATALSYRETIPDDLKPLLVLDASVRVKQTYRDMELHRGGMVRLPAAVKDYSDLTIHLWRAAASKSGFKAHGADLIRGVAQTILLKPAESWLVVTHKTGGKTGDIKAQILRELPPGVAARVAFLTWGQHMATNDYVDVENVVLAGQFFAPRSHYAALTHCSQGRDVAGGLVSRQEIEATVRGELANDVLQAVSRGRVRKCDGAKAKPMTAYIIATPRSGVPAAVPGIFPGCNVLAWKPFAKQLRGHVKLAVEYLTAAFEGGREEVSYKEVYEALKITKSNFMSRVANAADFKAAVTDMAAEIVRRGRERSLWVRTLPA